MSETTETQPRQGAHRVEVTLAYPSMAGVVIGREVVRAAEDFAQYAMTQHVIRFANDGELVVTIEGFTRLELSEFIEAARDALSVRSGGMDRDDRPRVVYAEA